MRGLSLLHGANLHEHLLVNVECRNRLQCSHFKRLRKVWHRRKSMWKEIESRWLQWIRWMGIRLHLRLQLRHHLGRRILMQPELQRQLLYWLGISLWFKRHLLPHLDNLHHLPRPCTDLVPGRLHRRIWLMLHAVFPYDSYLRGWSFALQCRRKVMCNQSRIYFQAPRWDAWGSLHLVVRLLCLLHGLPWIPHQRRL